MMGNTRDDDGPAPMMSSPREELRSLDVQRMDAVCGRAALVARLRQLLPRMEERGCARVLPFGLAAIDGQLPQGGLALDAVHELTGADEADMPAAFGFMAALLGHAAAAGRAGTPALLVLSRRRPGALGRAPSPGAEPGGDAGLAGAFAPQPRRVRQALCAWAEGARPSARPAPPPRGRGRPAGPVGARGGAAPARRPCPCRLAWRQARSQGQPPPADRRRKFRRPPFRA